jgi:hypothetical protein
VTLALHVYCCARSKVWPRGFGCYVSAMSFGDYEAERAAGDDRVRRLTAQAEGDRAARLVGRKSLVRRLLEHLRPGRPADESPEPDRT